MKSYGLIYSLVSAIAITLFIICGVPNENSTEDRDVHGNQAQVQIRNPIYTESDLAQVLFNAINEERIQRRLPPLAIHRNVGDIAKLRSDDMAKRGYFSHTSPEGETAFSLLDRYGIPYGWAGENLARNNYPGNQTAEVAIRDLMASEGHRANILSGHYTHLGVSVAIDTTGMKYYTMIFIGPRSSFLKRRRDESLRTEEKIGRDSRGSCRSSKVGRRIITENGAEIFKTDTCDSSKGIYPRVYMGRI